MTPRGCGVRPPPGVVDTACGVEAVGPGLPGPRGSTPARSPGRRAGASPRSAARLTRPSRSAGCVCAPPTHPARPGGGRGPSPTGSWCAASAVSGRPVPVRIRATARAPARGPTSSAWWSYQRSIVAAVARPCRSTARSARSTSRSTAPPPIGVSGRTCGTGPRGARTGPARVVQRAGSIATGSRRASWWFALRGVASTWRVRSSSATESDRAPLAASVCSSASSQCW